MGQIFCALVLFFVIFSVDARSSRRNSENGETLCSHNHPLFPYIKLFDVAPEEWKSENNTPNKKPVCFTRVVTTETDDNGKQLNKYSSYEITFGIPKKYENMLDSKTQENNGQELITYPPFELNDKKDDLTTKNVVQIKCSRRNTEPDMNDRRKSTYSPEMTTENHDLDFMNDLDEICEEHLDVDILNSLPSDDVTQEPDFGNTRRNGGSIDKSTEKITTVSDETEMVTIQPEENVLNILSRTDGTPSMSEITTELTNLITIILEDMNTSTETIIPAAKQDFTVSITPLEINLNTTEQPEEQSSITESIRKSDDVNAFMIQMKNYASPNAKPSCYYIQSKIKMGKCAEPLIPIRILTESKLPKKVTLYLVDNLESAKEANEFIVSGRKNCYLLKNLTTATCPPNHDELPTLLEIEDLPDNPNEEPFFTIEFDKKCTVVSKNVDVIECPAYQDTLPHLETENLPDIVRFKHTPGELDVQVDDIIVHSFSHCLLLKALHDVGCKDKPNIILKEAELPETRTTDLIIDEDSLPTYRLGDYSFEKFADIFTKSDEDSEETQEVKFQTTPCNDDDDDDDDDNKRTTRTLPHPTTPIPSVDRKSTGDCAENDVNCLMDKIKKQAEELKSRRTIKPIPEIVEQTTTVPATTLAEVKEIKIPSSKKLSKLLQTILEETDKESPLVRSSVVFKPDFIAKIACANQISQTSCFYVSKYIMQPSFDDTHEYQYLIDSEQLPPDAKIISAPNLNIFEANETIYASSDEEKFVLIKKQTVDCPRNPKDYVFVLDRGNCATKKAEQQPETTEPAIVKYMKGSKVYCFDFDAELKLHQIKCPDDISTIPVLSRPEDLKTLCRSQLKNKGQKEQMKLLRRLNIVTDQN